MTPRKDSNQIDVGKLLDISAFSEYGLIGENLMISVIRVPFYGNDNAAERAGLLHEFMKLGGVVQWLVMHKQQDYLDIVMTMHWPRVSERAIIVIRTILASTYRWSHDDYYEYWHQWHLLPHAERGEKDGFIANEMSDSKLKCDDDFLYVVQGSAVRQMMQFYEAASRIICTPSVVVAFYERDEIYLSNYVGAVCAPTDGNNFVLSGERDVHHPILRWMMMTIGGMRSSVIRSLIATHRITPLRQNINIDKIIEVEHGMVPGDHRKILS